MTSIPGFSELKLDKDLISTLKQDRKNVMAQSLKLQAHTRQQQLASTQAEEDAYARKQRNHILVLNNTEQTKQQKALAARKLLADT